jgi:hypothetical protein
MIIIIMEDHNLNSLIDNSSPLNEILRACYKYVSSDGNYYILADFINLDGVRYANWSLFNNTDDIAINDNEDSSPAILTTRSLKQDFDNMAENWEEKGYETVIVK